MRHLTLEALARLVDEAPTADELAHLDTCVRCTDELTRMGAQREALARLPDLRPPHGDWTALETRLAAEGLVRPRATHGTTRGGWRYAGWTRAAAAVLLFAAGSATGLSIRPGPAELPPDPIARDAATVDEAVELVRMAERRYVDALVQYRQLSGEPGALPELADPERRFAALDYLLAAGRVAVEQAPADPFMNGLLANILAERQATRDLILRTSGQVQEWF